MDKLDVGGNGCEVNGNRSGSANNVESHGGWVPRHTILEDWAPNTPRPATEREQQHGYDANQQRATTQGKAQAVARRLERQQADVRPSWSVVEHSVEEERRQQASSEAVEKVLKVMGSGLEAERSGTSRTRTRGSAGRVGTYWIAASGRRSCRRPGRHDLRRRRRPGPGHRRARAARGLRGVESVRVNVGAGRHEFTTAPCETSSARGHHRTRGGLLGRV